MHRQDELLKMAAQCFRRAEACEQQDRAAELRQRGREYLKLAHADGEIVDSPDIMTLSLLGERR